MMRNAIRFTILTAVLFSAGALAQFGSNTTFNFLFPTFAAVYTNVTQVDFFNSTSGTVGALSANNVAGYYAGTAAGVVSCIDALTSLPNSYTVNGSGGTSSATCNFAPNAVTKDIDFTVDGYTNAATPDTDGELLIITNASSYTIGITVSGSISSASVYAIPGYVQTGGSIGAAGTATAANIGTSASSLFDEGDAFATQYNFAKVIPLLFYAQVDVLNTANITSAETMTVTWTASAP